MPRFQSIVFLLLFSLIAQAIPCVVQLSNIAKRLEQNAFEIRRGLSVYRTTLGPRFMSAYNALTKDDLWIDSGAGASIAIAEHYMEHADHNIPLSETASTLSITVARPTINELIEKEKKIEVIPYDHTESARREYYGKRYKVLDDSVENGKHQFKEGYLENIPLESLKKAKLITDVMGPSSYAQDFPGVIRKYLQMLEEGGSVFINIAVSKTSIYTDRHEDVFGWLRRHVKGADVFMASPAVIQLKRNADSIEVPDLKLVMINDGQPPGRHYELPDKQ